LNNIFSNIIQEPPNGGFLLHMRHIAMVIRKFCRVDFSNFVIHRSSTAKINTIITLDWIPFMFFATDF